MIYFIYLPSYLLLFYSFYLFKRNIENNIIEIGFLTGIFYFIFIPLTTYLINNGYDSYDILANESWSNHSMTIKDFKTNIILSFLIFLNIFLLNIFYFYKKKKVKKKRLLLVKRKKLLIIIIFSIVPMLILELLIPSSITHWYAKAKYMNEHFGMMAVVSKYIYTSMRFVILLLLLNNFHISKKYHYLLFVLILGVIDMFVTGNRIFLVIISFSILLELILMKKYKLLFLSTIVAFPIASFMIAWAQIRSLMGNMSLWESIEISFKVFEKINISDIIFQLTEGADFLILLSIVRDFGTKVDYLIGESFLKVFVFFIPRSIYENKPDSIARTMGNYYQPETDGLALNSTLLGEEFANFSLLGVIIIMLLLLLFSFLQKVSYKYISYYMLPFYFFFPFLMIRTNVSDVFIQLIIALVVLFTITKKGVN